MKLPPMFFPKNVMVLSPIVRYLVHFELIFLHNTKSGSNFILLHVDIQFSQKRLLKGGYFLSKDCFSGCFQSNLLPFQRSSR